MKNYLNIFAALLLCTTLLSSCKERSEGELEQAVGSFVNSVGDALEDALQSGTGSATAENNDIVVKMEGAINHDKYDKTQSATVEFSRIPKTIAEFKKVQQTLGVEPHGAVALEVMAMEMYLVDPDLGRQALELNNSANNISFVVDRLKEHRRENDSYAQRYLMASFLKGATPENGYNPTKPYTVQVRVNPAVAYSEDNFGDNGTYINLQVLRGGSDRQWHGVRVCKPYGSDYFLVNNNPDMYVQCKKIKAGQTFNGLE
ncbi:MAG: hypothetical protein IKI67_02580 [Bacteroidales bacterium]|nr:hypothetical protein [Bacteroidales bacterium]